MAAYNTCLQVTFILVQLVFLAFGGVMVGVGAWLEVQEQSISAAIEGESFQAILAGPYIIIAAGCAIVLLAAIGIIGALCDTKMNRFLLIFYIILVLIVFLAQLVGGILGFVFREDLEGAIADGLEQTLDRYGVNTSDSTLNLAVTEAWDFVQETLDCCGPVSFRDWINNSTGDFGEGNIFPMSCCVPFSNGTVPDCNGFNDTNVELIHDDGCIIAVTDFIREQLLIVAAIGIAFVVAEIVVVLMAFCLICCTDFDD